EKATHVEEVTGEESPGRAYMEAGILTVDRADIMVVVWNGKPAAGVGGTGDVVAYTRELGKPLVIIDPDSGQITEERFDRRQTPAEPPPAGWNENPQAAVEKCCLELDEEAKRLAPKSRHLVLRIILFQVLASAIGFTALAFEIHGRADEFIMFVELILLGAAFALSLQHRQHHHEWMEKRIKAEICRSFLAMWHIHRQADHFPKISIQGLGRFCRNLQMIRILDKTPSPPLESVRDQYLTERLEDQRRYFSGHSAKARIIHQRLKALALLSTAVATSLSLLALTLPLLKFSPSSLAVPKYISLLLPLVSAAIYSLLITQDHSRRAVRYNEMAAMLEDAGRRLKQVQTWNSLARIAQETETALLQEIVEWHSFRQFTGEPH
ncbi:MAG TPA: SLATT domain-containing protein, partial [Candidatus Nitrosopolaris sp.]|nr:SLATT domain-containing protein [Candidatus Nitrosopolaris sp.]